MFSWRRNSSPSIFSDVYSKPFWVQHTGAARQAHTCQAIILRNDKVAGMYAVHQREIYAVGTFVKGQCLCAVTLDLVGSIA